MPEIPKTLADIFAQASIPAVQGNYHPPTSRFDANPKGWSSDHTVQAFASGFAAAVQNLAAGLQDPAQIGQELRARAEQLMEMADLCDLVQASQTASAPVAAGPAQTAPPEPAPPVAAPTEPKA